LKMFLKMVLNTLKILKILEDKVVIFRVEFG
jgi:hypothetical protein